MFSAFPSAILYLNGDFDGGNFYFTELDAKTVTVSAPLSHPWQTETPKVQGKDSHSVFLVASAPLPKPEGLGGVSTAPLTGHLSSLAWSLGSQAEKPPTIEKPDDSVPLLKAGDNLSCVPFCALQAEVQPQCGRAVGFSSGTENPHGVKAVTRGQRCAIALWFTLDARHSERVRLVLL